MDTVTVGSTFATAIGTMATDISNGIIAILPSLLPILGVLILVAILVRVIQRVTGRRA